MQNVGRGFRKWVLPGYYKIAASKKKGCHQLRSQPFSKMAPKTGLEPFQWAMMISRDNHGGKNTSLTESLKNILCPGLVSALSDTSNRMTNNFLLTLGLKSVYI